MRVPWSCRALTRWGELNGCLGEPESNDRPKYDLTTPVERNETTINTFKECLDGSKVEFWYMEGGVPHPPLFFRVAPNGIKILAEKI